MEKTFCSVCAWRRTCQKRFGMKDGICPDFTKDLTLKDDKKDKNDGDRRGHEKQDS